MAFFFKKNEAATPETKVRNSPMAPPSSFVAQGAPDLPVVAVNTPSAEGLAIAQRLSGQRTAVPAGFRVRADHFQLEGGCLVAGELEGRVLSHGRNEVAPGGVVSGVILGDEFSVRGLMTGQGAVDRLTIQPGGECRGSFKGSSLVLSEGGVFDGEYARSQPKTPPVRP